MWALNLFNKKTVYREKEAVREAYNLFNEYADSLYGSDKTNQESKLYFAFKIICELRKPHTIYLHERISLDWCEGNERISLDWCERNERESLEWCEGNERISLDWCEGNERISLDWCEGNEGRNDK